VIKRRPFVVGCLALFTARMPIAAEAQQADKVWRIGFLEAGSSSVNRHFLDAFRQGLNELGYQEGRQIAIEDRWAEGRNDRFPGLVAELIRLKVAVIVAASTPATLAAKNATKEIPIVMTLVSDLVGGGFVASLSRPGGNITGLASIANEVVGKQLELLKEAVPQVSLVAVLWNPANPAFQTVQLRQAEVAAKALRVRLQVLEACSSDELDATFGALTGRQAGALLVLADGMFFRHRARITGFAAKRRLPAIFQGKENVEAGGLMSYGVSIPDMFHRAATYVDKILKGAKAADLPVEQPTKFELVINLKTAKSLGLTIPQSLLQRADQVIE
jgi:putative ABC transport system substrate-binding protein